MTTGYQVARPRAPRKSPDGGERAPSFLNSRLRGFIESRDKEHLMLALYIILGFVAVLAAINFIEFGRVD
jgi:hypothetical protein